MALEDRSLPATSATQPGVDPQYPQIFSDFFSLTSRVQEDAKTLSFILTPRIMWQPLIYSRSQLTKQPES